MMDTTQYGGTMVGEQALMNALESLQVVESENDQLKKENATLKEAAENGYNPTKQMDEVSSTRTQFVQNLSRIFKSIRFI